MVQSLYPIINKIMWNPSDIFFILWHLNFSPCDNARLNVKDVIETQENKAIQESVTLRKSWPYSQAGQNFYYFNSLDSFERNAISWDKNILVYSDGLNFIYELDSTK